VKGEVKGGSEAQQGGVGMRVCAAACTLKRWMQGGRVWEVLREPPRATILAPKVPFSHHTRRSTYLSLRELPRSLSRS